MAGNLLVLAERRGGELKRPSLEAVSVARRLAETTRGDVVALAFGPGASSCAQELGACGARRLVAVEAEHAALYAPELYVSCIAQVAREHDAAVVLAPGTALGRDVLPRAAARLGTACANDLVEIDVTGEGVLRGKRPVYSGKAFARVAIPRSRPAMATLRPNVFPVDARPGAAPAEPS